MSVAFTEQAVIERRKTVTRRRTHPEGACDR